MGAVPPEIPIRLDATPLGRSLYERYGFQDEAELTRHVAEPSRLAGDPTCDLTARPVRGLTPVDLRSVIAQDDRVFGAHRRILLEWALHGAAHYAHVIDTDAGVQYCFGRPGRLFDQIGPVVAADDETARAARGRVAPRGGRQGGRRRCVRPSRRVHRVAADPRVLRLAAAVSHAPPRAAWPRNAKRAATRACNERAILGPEFG